MIQQRAHKFSSIYSSTSISFFFHFFFHYKSGSTACPLHFLSFSPVIILFDMWHHRNIIIMRLHIPLNPWQFYWEHYVHVLFNILVRNMRSWSHYNYPLQVDTLKATSISFLFSSLSHTCPVLLLILFSFSSFLILFDMWHQIPIYCWQFYWEHLDLFYWEHPTPGYWARHIMLTVLLSSWYHYNYPLQLTFLCLLI